MHLKSILLLLVFFLILSPLETVAQVQDSVAVSDSAVQALIRQMYEQEKQLMEHQKNKQILQLKDQERSMKSKRMIVIVLIVAGVLIFVAGLVLLVLWIIRKQ